MLDNITILVEGVTNWKQVWSPFAVLGTGLLVEWTKKLAPKIPDGVKPLYSMGIGIGLSYLAQWLGLPIPGDLSPAVAGAAVGSFASTGWKVIKEAQATQPEETKK